MRLFAVLLVALPMCRKAEEPKAERFAIPIEAPIPPPLRFVSQDPSIVMVLEQAPEADEHVSLGGIERDGKPVADLTPASLHLPRTAMRVQDGRVRWLGKAEPTPYAAGVEVELLDGSRLRIPFDPNSPVDPPRPPRVQFGEVSIQRAALDAGVK